jgi:RNA polymerase sigma-70 factor (ECF subfamily)
MRKIADRRGPANKGQHRSARELTDVDDERTTFDNLVMPHLADALALARWLTKNRADAEDIMQEACLRAFRSIHNCAGSNPRAWVLTIVRNTAYSWLQKNRRSEVVAIDDLEAQERLRLENGGEWMDQHASTPETELIAKVNADQLRAAIDSLPLEFRETVVLRDIHGLEYREIAEIVAAPIGTVMSRLSRARRHLLNTIQKESARSRPALRSVRN